MSEDDSKATLFGAMAGSAALGFAMLAVASAVRTTSTVDRAVEKRAHVPRRRRAGRAARGMSPLVKTYTTVPLAIAAGGWLLTRRRDGQGITRRSREVGAVAIVASAVVSALAEPLFDRFLPQPPMPRGRTHRRAVFPSGHTFKPAALALTCAHVLSREGVVRRDVAYGLAIVLPVASGAAKIVARKHWLSDVIGGAFAGVAIGSACCAAYEGMCARGGAGFAVDW